jgi:crotonobetainyl-CoA:carnitine CoA-transferase CaiB-like acyl-CoA transferase
VYPTRDGFIAIAMTPLNRLAELLDIDALAPYCDDPSKWFTERDAIKAILGKALTAETTDHWLSLLEPADIWCAEVLRWPEFLESEGFKVLDMLQTVERADGVRITTTRSPIRVDGNRPGLSRAAPTVGEQSAAIRAEFNL